VGDGVDKVRLEGRYGEADGVKMLGKVLPPDLYELYKMGAVFVTASPIETQGIVLIEAAASGMPLIAVDAGAVAEVCRDGENGVLCQPGSVEEMAQAIVKAMSDDKLREKYSRRSVEIAHEHDFEKTLDKFINIYSKVVRDASGGVELAV
ncbi:glycosyltransferase, partial [Candidatus Saccharibacteria bacterium]|nr:glycosyltransferase [Candidatus Saccharibacteria bacterium]